ncbi:MAG: sodium:proton antiporter [Proteobacteria bacterium]|nr:sodium:proton antiporter [Pseudomonadota bacterium]
MLTTNAILFFIILLLLAEFIEPLVNKLHIPFTIILVVLGFIGSEITIHVFEIDTGIRWHNFKTIIFYIILPILIFQAAIEINIKLLWKNLLPILIMALPLMVLSAVITAAGVYYAINHPPGFPWIAALITGALLSATDPAAVISLLKKADAPERLRMLLEGESLFNDATAIVLFSIFIVLATSSHEATGFSMVFYRFSEVFFGGLLAGGLVGFAACLLLKVLKAQQAFVLVSVISAYTAFIIAEDILHFSGVIAVLLCGIVIGICNEERLSENSFASQFWQFLSRIAESLIFLLAGVTITLSMFVDQWLAILIGIVAVTLARCLSIIGAFPLISLLPGVEKVPFKQQTILVWGGVRGTVTIALALSLPLSLDYWYTIQSIAYGVVIFTLFVQTITMPLLLKRLGN